MQELKDFYNDGFGWVCRQCSLEDAAEAAESKHSRLLTEGESEGKVPRLSMKALAKWLDPSERVLVCPRCAVTEMIDLR